MSHILYIAVILYIAQICQFGGYDHDSIASLQLAIYRMIS